MVCRELGLGYAQAGTQTHMFNGNNTVKPAVSGVSCRSDEAGLSECHHDKEFFCPGSGNEEVAAVICVPSQADLVPDLYTLMATVYLEDKHLFFLQVFQLRYVLF